MMQVALLCGCGSPDIFRKGMCRKCLRRQKLNVENFDGLRELVLLRDDRQCQVCGWDGTLVHHRRPGLNTMAKLITLCLKCHAKVHHTLRPGLEFASHPLLVRLWREQHCGLPEQMLLLAGGDAERVEQVRLFEIRQ